MKRIFIIAVAIFLAIYGYSKFREHQRFNPLSNYDYAISEDVEVQYHDVTTLKEYYEQPRN